MSERGAAPAAPRRLRDQLSTAWCGGWRDTCVRTARAPGGQARGQLRDPVAGPARRGDVVLGLSGVPGTAVTRAAQVRLASDSAFSAAGVARIELHVEPDNAASRAVAHRAGFREAGVGPVGEGEPRDVLLSVRARSNDPR